MKKQEIPIIYIILVLIPSFVLFSCKQQVCHEVSMVAFVSEKKIIPVEIEADNLVPTFPRESITFILGDDREEENPFYEEAARYYQFNEMAKTTHVVKNCRSLLDVREYLVENPPSDSLPWGLINLVSHGNQWLGLSVEVVPESKRSSVELIDQCIDDGTFKKLPAGIIDYHTEVVIHACGIGNNKDFVEIMAKVFESNEAIPMVRASKLFEYYTSSETNGMVMESQQFYAEAWFTNYRMGYKPTLDKLFSKLTQKYPESRIDWKDALSREQPRYNGDIYYYTFEVPVKWVVPYMDENKMPDVSTIEKQLQWLRSQNLITSALKRIEIPIEDFNWWFRKVFVDNDDGSKSPAIWVKGYSTILCVLKPLVEERNTEVRLAQVPFIPDANDADYFYNYGGVVKSCKPKASSSK